MSERTIVHMRFGSQVYGTSLPTSDQDFKEVFVPDGRDILLGRATKVSRSSSTKVDTTARNTAADIDSEAFSYAGFLRLLAEGQTVATDMLFVPAKDLEYWNSTWDVILDNRGQLVSRRISGFVGYCKAQANKYGIKGSRVNAAQQIIYLLEQFRPEKRLGDYITLLEGFCEETEHAEMIDIPTPSTAMIRQPLPHLSVCNRKQSMTVTVKYALSQYRDLEEKYGERARQAAANEGIDWKALMHAVRIGNQAHELLATGVVTFPRPEAALLLQIRKGEIPYAQVAEVIELSMESLEAAQELSVLPKEPNQALIDELITETYRSAITCS